MYLGMVELEGEGRGRRADTPDIFIFSFLTKIGLQPELWAWSLDYLGLNSSCNIFLVLRI